MLNYAENRRKLRGEIANKMERSSIKDKILSLIKGNYRKKYL